MLRDRSDERELQGTLKFGFQEATGFDLLAKIEYVS